MEQDADRFAMEPVPPFECHVRSTWRSSKVNARSESLQAQACKVAQEGSPDEWSSRVGCRTGGLTCLRSLNQVDVPPRDGVDKQAGHDALRENA